MIVPHYDSITKTLSNGTQPLCCPTLWASYQTCKIVGWAFTGNAGNVFPATWVSDPDMHHSMCHPQNEGILPKGPYPPCLRMADRALLAGYPRETGGQYQYEDHHCRYRDSQCKDKMVVRPYYFDMGIHILDELVVIPVIKLISWWDHLIFIMGIFMLVFCLYKACLHGNYPLAME